MRRHEIWTAAGGTGYAGKPRPVVVLQDERIALESVTFCGFTTDLTEAPGLWRPLVKATASNGLETNSAIMVDKIMTMPRARFGRRIGNLDSRDVTALERALLFFLGLQT